MKEGVKVKVIASITGHDFQIGEIVERRHGKYEDNENMGFYSDRAGVWYMSPDEYEILDKQRFALDLLIDAAYACHSAGFSRGVWELAFAAADQGEEEIQEGVIE